MQESDLLSLIKSRHSCRAFSNQPVEDEKIDQIIEAGILSPTGMNRQETIFLKIGDPILIEELEKLNAAFTHNPTGHPFYGAKSLIVVLAGKSSNTRVYDGSIAMGYMMLEASSLGLGSCWIHRAKEVFETEQGKAILKKAGIEGDYEGIGNLILGYEDPDKNSLHPKQGDGRIYSL